MEDTPKIYEKLYDVSDAGKARHEVIAFIKQEMRNFITLSEDTYKSAYALAGLMATDYVRSLPESDPIVDLLDTAGELEIAPPNSEDLRKDILQKIELI